MRARIAAVLAALAALILAGAAAADPGGEPWSGHRITVETRNLFVGFDAGALLSGAITPEQAWATLLASEPHTRAERWADEIAATRPDVVGLQEAPLIEVVAPPPGIVAFDFVQLLVDALADRGLAYEAVATATNLVAQAPVGPTVVQFTDRDVTLVRVDPQGGRLKVVAAGSGNFAAALPVPVFGSVPRGWTSVDVKLHGRTVRVVNTHLEAFHPGIRLAQAAELLAGPASNPGPTILVGDFNSGPGATLETYALLTSAFEDVWPAVGAGPGLTCCHDDLTPAIPYTDRVDLVLAEPGIEPVSAQVIGDVPAASFPFFPSDHAGVVATLELP